MAEANQREAIDLGEKCGLFSDQWSPRIIAGLNDLHVKIAKIEGEFVWHSHAETDEFFLVHKGSFVMEYRDRSVTLKAGDVHIVPRGVEHRPVAAAECEIVMIEPAGTLNTGDAGGDRTVEAPPWI
ncbi:MAG: cupin domain-containing protein [Pseudomonadota bacterium]